MPTPHPRRAFTLVELLVVVVIIAVLMTIGLVIGARARSGARVSATQNTIKILDNALTALVSVNGEMPRPYVNVGDPPTAPPNIRQLMIDNITSANTDPKAIACGWFVYQASQIAEAKTILEAINPKYVLTRTDVPEAPGFRVINDAFGFPIRYVHPALHGVYTSRNALAVFGNLPPGLTYRPSDFARASTGGTPNSDGGQVSGNRPYFYSPGEDGDPATREDNIYAENGKPAFIDGP